MSIYAGSDGRSETRRGRFMIVATAIASLGLLVSACGGSGESDEKARRNSPNEETRRADPDNCPVAALDEATNPVEITVWHAYFALSKQAMEKTVEEYNASQDKVKVNLESQGYYPEMQKKYEDRLSDPSQLPDVIFANNTAFRVMVDSDSVIPADDCISADPNAKAFYDELLPVVRQTYSVQDTLWPASFTMSMPVLYVNQTLLSKAGVDESTPMNTLADVRAVAEKIKAANIPGLEAPLSMELYSSWWETWITGAGETIVNENNGHDGLATKSTLDNKAALETLEWLKSMYDDGLLKAYPESNGLDHVFAIANKSAAMLIEGSLGLTSVNAVAQSGAGAVEEAEGIDPADLEGLVGEVRMFPGVKRVGQVNAAASAGFVVAGQDPQKVAAAWDFLQFFNGTTSQIRWTTMGSSLPVTNAVRNSPEIKDYFANDSGGKLLKVADDQFVALGLDNPTPIIGPFDWFRAETHSLLGRVVLQHKDPKTELDKMDSAFQSALDEYRQEVGG